VHSKQKHSFDLLFFEFLKIMMWFNPMIFLYQKRITLVHEYISDELVAKSETKEIYINNLLSNFFQVESISFVNQFYNQTFIKKRIIMIKKTQSKQINQLKYLLLMPVLAGMLFYTSCTSESNKDKLESLIQENKQLKESLNAKNRQLGVPFMSVNKAPIYPGCEQGDKDCFSKMVQTHFSKNFNNDLPNTLGLDSGKKRVFIAFIIDDEGNVADVKARAPHIDIKNEVIRVMNTLPKMIPGENNGKKVAVKYAIPFTIIVA
jgi:hypothetical protein